MKRLSAVGILLGSLLLATVPALPASAATITPALGGWVDAGDTVPFALTLTDSPWDSAIVTIELAEGTMTVDDAGLALTLEPGSASFTDVATVSFTGPIADVQTALSDRLTWTAPATPEQSYLRLSVTIEQYIVGLSTNDLNGHSYLPVSTLLSWSDARDAASAMTYRGLTGYLTTITDAAENAFVTTASAGATLSIGATDEIAYINPFRAADEQYPSNASIQGNFHWGSGPEAGTPITFAQWFPGEPNNTATERCTVTNWFVPTGEWNNTDCSSAFGYIVEFGGIGTAEAATTFDNLDSAAPPLPEPDPADPDPADPAAGDGEVPMLAETGAEVPPVGVAILAAMLLAGLALRVRKTAPRGN